jgi:hypothetical protein
MNMSADVHAVTGAGEDAGSHLYLTVVVSGEVYAIRTPSIREIIEIGGRRRGRPGHGHYRRYRQRRD